MEELQNQASIAQSEESECHFKVGFSAEGGGASQKIKRRQDLQLDDPAAVLISDRGLMWSPDLPLSRKI